jgi:hypothetical protein
MTKQGNASGGKRAQHTGRIANNLIDSAWEFIRRQSVLPEHPPSGSQLIYFLGLEASQILACR